MTPHNKTESRTRQILNFLDLRVGPAFVAVIFAAGVFFMRYDTAFTDVKVYAREMRKHKEADQEKFDKITQILIKLDTQHDDIKGRVTRIENRLDANGNPVERR